MADKKALLLGHAREDITPPLGVSMAGYAYRKDAGCTAILQPIFADACFMQQGDFRLVIITLDLCLVDEQWSTPVRERIAAQLGLPVNHVAIMASHTHFGPSTGRPVNDEHAAWQQECFDKMYQIAIKAAQNPQPATIRVAKADISRIAYNRRPVRADGTCCTAYTLPAPEANLRFRPIDPMQTVIRFDGVDGRPVMLFVSTPMHAVVGGSDSMAISPDYPGMLRAAVESVYNAPMMFAAGTAGNVVPFKRGLALRKIIGNYLAGAALQATEMAEACGGQLGLVQKRIDIPVAERLDEATMQARVDAAKANLATCQATGDAWAINRAEYAVQRAEALSRAAQRRGPGNTMPFDITVIGLGEMAIVCLPGEIFAETGLHIQARSPFPQTLVVSLTNQQTGYLATANAVWEGGYEGATSQYSEESEIYACNQAVLMLMHVWEATR